MATAPDETLKPGDAIDVLDEIVGAQNHSYELGLKLKLPRHEVDSIHSTYPKPRSRLLHVLIEFTEKVEPKPTWRVIIDALRSPSVGLPRLAKKVEEAHFPTTTSPVVPEPIEAPDQGIPATQQSQQATNTVNAVGVGPSSATANSPFATATESGSPSTGDGSPSSKQESRPPSPVPSPMTLRYVQAKIKQFEKKFNGLKKACKAYLEKLNVSVKRITDALTDLPADDVDEHKQFLESHLKVLYQADDISELIGTLRFNMNYLSYHLLDYLYQEFVKDLQLKKEMDTYKKDLQQFRQKTPLALFCQAQRKRRIKLSPEFEEVVAEFDWQGDVTLEAVEEFRREYAWDYNLREFAMMLAQARPGSFIITWFIPRSIVEKLKTKVPRYILQQHSVTKLEIAGTCVYRGRLHKHEMLPTAMSMSSHAESVASFEAAKPRTQRTMSVASAVGPFPEEDYPFVEKPPEDLMCPVMKTLLLQPHLTSCCGNHISEEAASRIQREGGACPLCNATNWRSMLSKHLQRQVNALRLFCHHKDRGCEWQGELSDMERHIQSCPRKYDSLEIGSGHLWSQMWANMAPTWMWREGKNAPEKMTRGASVVHGNTAYFRPADSTKIYSYQNIAGEKQWSQLPDNPNVNCGLAVIDGLLTSVGGDNNGPTNVLLSLTGEGERKQWLEIFPPMPTPRYGAACVNTERGLVVAGGYAGGDLAIVETMDTYKWWRRSIKYLPEEQSYLSGAVHGRTLYLAGGLRDGRPSQSVYTYKLDNVFPPLIAISGSSPFKIPTPTSRMLQQKPKQFSRLLPVTHATLASFNDCLLAIGGSDDSGNATKNVYVYNKYTDSWKAVKKMRNKRYSCLTATLPGDRLIIVGGCSSQSHEAYRVEILQ